MLKSNLNKMGNFFSSSKKYFIVLSLIVLVSIIKLSSNFENITNTDNNNYFIIGDNKLNIQIPKNMNFANEKVPIENSKIKESIEKELLISTYWQAQTLLLHKRASRWFPIIEPILKRNNVPDDFKYLAIVESQLTNVVSRQGATGFWQLIIPTAESYGLEINDEVDERYDISKSTEAACKYFNEAYKQFNNWTLVAASYNLGIAGLQDQLKKQKVKDYYNLILTNESARYIFRLLSIKEIISRPRVYGLVPRKKDLYPEISFKKIVVDSCIHSISTFAENQGIDYKTLKLFNPWLMANSLTNSKKKKYIIEIPKGKISYSDWNESYQEANNFLDKDSTNLFVAKNDSVNVRKPTN